MLHRQLGRAPLRNRALSAACCACAIGYVFCGARVAYLWGHAAADNGLLNCIQRNNSGCVAVLLKAGASPNAKVMSSGPRRYWAYLAYGVDAPGVPGAECALLRAIGGASSSASSSASARIIRELVRHGANVDIAHAGWPAVMLAAEHCTPEVVAALLEGHPNVNAACDGRTALMAAMERVPDFHGLGAPQIAALLIAAGCDTGARDAYGNRAIDSVVQQMGYSASTRSTILGLLRGSPCSR